VTAIEFYYEDLTPGRTFRLGPRKVAREEMMRFASRFDPQAFHLDDKAAAATPFGKLSASGWQTAAVSMRLMADGLMNKSASMGSPGIDELRWLKPVFAGDELTVVVTVISAVPSKSRPDRGTVTLLTEAFDAQGTKKMFMRSRVMFGRRPASAA
jgi:acyl dehydratase